MEKLLIFLGTIMVILVMSLLFAFPIMWLWNWLMPVIFGLIKITFWQALGVNLLCGILFKNINSISKDN